MYRCGMLFRFVLSLLAVCATSSELVEARHNPRSDIGLNISKILDAFFDHGYDKRVRPNYGGSPVEVNVSMFIVSISSVSEVLMDFTSDFYFRQVWKDPRLSFEARPGIEALSVGAEVAERIWVPDTFFANEKSAYYHIATTPNTFLRIRHRGEVFRSMRLTVTAGCPMDLKYFPMDRQKCTIEVESYGYSMADIKYRWMSDNAVAMTENLTLPQFKIIGHMQRSRVVVLSTGNYSRLICEVQLVRSMGYYMIQIYIPASLIVIISWVSFWLHRNATPARVQLGVLTVLTMTTLMSSTNSQLPKISYVKSIDVFLGTCFVMVFAALLEYAAVGYIGKRISMRKNRFQQLAKAADEKRRRLLAAEAAVGMRYRSCDDLDTPPPPQPVAHYATIRRHMSGLGDCRTGLRPSTTAIPDQPLPPPPTTSATVPSSRSLSHLLTSAGATATTPTVTHSASHNNNGGHHSGHHRPSEVRLDILGTKTTATTSPTGECDLDALSPSSPQSHNHHHSLTHPDRSGLRLRTPSASAPTSATFNQVVRSLKTKNGTTGKSPKNLNELFGVSPSDIDKYSRVVFPVCFVCFNLMYWLIYLHISNIFEENMIDDEA